MTINWQAVNFDWNHIKAFLLTIEQGSLSAAAKTLQVAQPTLSRQMAALERSLGIVLFERVGKGIEPTPQALALVEHVQIMAEAASALSLSAMGHNSSIAGTVRISCMVMAAFELSPVLKKLHQQYPNLQLDIMGTDTSSDLKRREADIAIRAYQPTEPDLIAKPLCDFELGLYATKSYAQSLGFPKTIEELTQAQFIGFTDGRDQYLEQLRSKGINVSDAQVMLRGNSHLAHWTLAKQGLGIGVMFTNIAEQCEHMVRLCPEQVVFEGQYWLVVHRELHTSRRVRVVFDEIYQTLGNSK
ncbi:LysR family transcriptional regulator [Veronia nyctiphanis]|uniref:LysR family transcriptional regulator n=1 Tax=Veronia nyctiphanis TaxID=1278244 RepID=A0A4Q0YLB8_9GAMM|nr:LysR family transcriptional regulator [Veronia nyctiphanis]RXJ71587.1 LysR family transcriptional regulator [Veronia nyctiphanis]